MILNSERKRDPTLKVKTWKVGEELQGREVVDSCVPFFFLTVCVHVCVASGVSVNFLRGPHLVTYPWSTVVFSLKSYHVVQVQLTGLQGKENLVLSDSNSEEKKHW